MYICTCTCTHREYSKMLLSENWAWNAVERDGNLHDASLRKGRGTHVTLVQLKTLKNKTKNSCLSCY